jgi:hypothetical protein
MYFITSCQEDICIDKINCINNDNSKLLNLWELEGLNPNILELCRSNDSTYIIKSKVSQLGKAPEIFLWNINSTEEKRITNNNFIEFSPVVNNEGDYAYALSYYNASASCVFLNGNLIEKTNKNIACDNLALNDKYLAYSVYNAHDNTHTIIVKAVKSENEFTFRTEFIPQKIKFLNSDQIICQGFNKVNLSNDLFLIDLYNNKIISLHDSEKDELLFQVDYGKRYRVIIPQKNKPLFNALYSIMEYQPFNSFVKTNDFMGRLAWNSSYRLESMININQKLKNKIFLDEIIENIESLLAVNNNSLGISNEFNPPFLWSSKKYSLDRSTPISLLVNNSRIMYPILLAFRYNLYSDSKVVDVGKKMYKYFENYYNQSDSLYHFQRGMKFWADGVVLPYNQQNAFGLCLIELYLITGNEKYRQRASELYYKFLTEINNKNDLISWSYWPSNFYKGWTYGDNISTNTPARKESTDKLKEDISHAGINVKFLVEYEKYIFPNDLVGQKCNRIVSYCRVGETYSRFISGDVAYSKPSIKYSPKYGWVDLKNNDLNQYYMNIYPLYYFYFDSEMAIVYSSFIEDLNGTYQDSWFDLEGKLIQLMDVKF